MVEKWWNRGADRGRKRRMREEEEGDDDKTREDGQKTAGSSVQNKLAQK